MASHLNLDPSRTSGIYRRFAATIRAQFLNLRRAIREFIHRGDALGLKPVGNAREFAYETDPAKLQSFERWLRTQLDDVKGVRSQMLWQKYIEQGFHNGVTRSYEALAKAKPSPDVREALGARNQFLYSAKNSAETVDKVKLLASRTFSELDGLTDRMRTRLGRTLADGVMQGLSPSQIADALVTDVGVEEKNALSIARTEIVRANSEAQLLALSRLGVKNLRVLVEWTTAGDPCKRCESMRGKDIPIEQASGRIPLHRNCRCAWTPQVAKLGSGRRLFQAEGKK